MERDRQNDDEHHKMWELSHWTWGCNPTCGSVFIVLFPAQYLQYLDIYTISRYLHNISAAALLGIEIQEVRFPGFPAPRLAAVRWEWVVGMRWWITISSIYYIYLVSALIISIPSAHDTVCLSCAISLPLFVENELSKIAQNGRLSPLFVLPHFAHFNLT